MFVLEDTTSLYCEKTCKERKLDSGSSILTCKQPNILIVYYATYASERLAYFFLNQSISYNTGIHFIKPKAQRLKDNLFK